MYEFGSLTGKFSFDHLAMTHWEGVNFLQLLLFKSNESKGTLWQIIEIIFYWTFVE
jgi:hypothetical protein